MLTRGAGVGRICVSSGISLFLCLLALVSLLQGLTAPAALSFQSESFPETEEPSKPPKTPERRQLRAEVGNYRDIIAALRDSLKLEETNGFGLSLDQRERLEGNIVEITDVIAQISEKLSELEFEIKDNRLSLVNELGEGIIINLPDDLDQRMSEGIQAITQFILAESDSIDFSHARNWDWKGFRPDPPKPAKRVINGNIIKIWDDAEISASEDVRGQVVVIFGDAQIDGRVDGNVVTVFGNLLISDGAEVTGTAVAVGGYLDQESEASVGNVVSVDLLRIGQKDGWQDFYLLGGWSFLITEVGFVLTLFLAIIAVFVLPRKRIEHVISTLQNSPLASLGLGTLAALAGHITVAILLVVLVLTVIGMPLALLVTLALALLVLAAIVACSAAVGQYICKMVTGQCRAHWLAVLVGMLVLHSVSFVGSVLAQTSESATIVSTFVILGILIKMTAYLLGLGAIIISRFGLKGHTD